MKTLIVPCIGRSLLKGKPKYLARHPEGKLLSEKCIEGIPTEKFSRIIFVLLREDVEVFKADKIIVQTLQGLPVEVLVFEKETSGPAETVYQTIRQANIEGEIVIKDSDNYLKVKELEYPSFVAGLDLNEWNRDIHHLRNKSFLIINEQKQILDIFEKQFKSDVISVGLYGFSDAKDFLAAYQKLNDNSYPIKKLYVSHIISYLIGYWERVFRYIPCTEYENWANEKVWNAVQKSYATYFVDLDALTLDEKDLKQMTTLYQRGAHFIGYTVKGKAMKDIFVAQAEEYNFKYLDIVFGVTYSDVKRIIGNSSDLSDVRYDA